MYIKCHILYLEQYILINKIKIKIKIFKWVNLLFLSEASEARVTHGEGLHEAAAESSSQNIPESNQDLLTVHGTTQGESSDAVSIHTASTSVSGNGKHTIHMWANEMRINIYDL